MIQEPQNHPASLGYIPNSLGSMSVAYPTGSQAPENTAQYLQAIENNHSPNVQMHNPQNAALDHTMNVYMRGETDHRLGGNSNPFLPLNTPSVGSHYFPQFSLYTHQASAPYHYTQMANHQQQGPRMRSMDGQHFHGRFIPNAQADVSYQAHMQAQAHPVPNFRPVPLPNHDPRYPQAMNTTASAAPSQIAASHTSPRRRPRLRLARVGRPSNRPIPMPASMTPLTGPNVTGQAGGPGSSRPDLYLDHRSRFIVMQQQLDFHRRHMEAIKKEESKGLDNQDDGRPPPMESEDMTVSLECKICMTQLIDTVMLPCGHACLCRWCAELHLPPSQVDRSKLRANASCPMCRRNVQQKVRVYLATSD